MREIVLPNNEAVKKLDNFLKKRFPIGYVRKLFRKNSVRLNGRRAKPEDLVRPGDRIQVYIDFEKPAETSKPHPALTKLDIVYEDNALLVLNKPAGIAVHEGKTVSKKESLLGHSRASSQFHLEQENSRSFIGDTQGQISPSMVSFTSKQQ